MKLIDFGFANILTTEDDLDDVIGTPYYMAPEIIAKKKYRYKVDIWSLGVLVYYIIDGSYPFDAETKNEIFKKILNGSYEYHNKANWEKVTEECKDFIKRCLTK